MRSIAILCTNSHNAQPFDCLTCGTLMMALRDILRYVYEITSVIGAPVNISGKNHSPIDGKMRMAHHVQ